MHHRILNPFASPQHGLLTLEEAEDWMRTYRPSAAPRGTPQKGGGGGRGGSGGGGKGAAPAKRASGGASVCFWCLTG
jgi:uncharacterized membrane protein